jgi:hypothetical protein
LDGFVSRRRVAVLAARTRLSSHALGANCRSKAALALVVGNNRRCPSSISVLDGARIDRQWRAMAAHGPIASLLGAQTSPAGIRWLLLDVAACASALMPGGRMLS